VRRLRAYAPRHAPDALQKFFENRVKGINAAKAAGLNPFPHKFHVSTPLPAFVSTYAGLETGTHEEGTLVSVAGARSTHAAAFARSAPPHVR
jgi:lysyl-tRNA synthetase class 2